MEPDSELNEEDEPPMSFDFIAQPEDAFRLGDFLQKSFANPAWTDFRAAIAFVKRSGTKHIKVGLEDFSKRATVTISAGVDAGGTSVEGLKDLIDAVAGRGRVCIFHNANPSTFHPKIYLFKNSVAAEVVIGSGNLTEGGLFTNYEASVLCHLDLSIPDHQAFLKSIEDALDAWSTEAEGLCHLLDDGVLAKLVVQGLIPPEAKAWGGDEKKTSSPEGEEEPEASLFKRHAVPKAPKAVAPAAAAEPLPGDEQEPEDDEGLVVVEPAPVPEQAGNHKIFLMTLQKTDVGTGQTSLGTQRRSPEIFIPLICRNYDPEFWGWPDLFVADSTWTGPIDRDGRGKMDRTGVKVRLGGETFPVTIWYNPDKKDQRIRSEHIRSAGVIDDILYVERSDGQGGFSYYIDVIPQGTTKHAEYLALCTHPVRNSKKKWGYI